MKYVNFCGDVYMMMFVIFGDTCTIGDFNWYGYFGDNNEAWIICDLVISLMTMISLFILLKWWIVFVELIKLNEEWGEKFFYWLMLLRC